MKTFDEYKITCEYFERKQNKRNINNGTFIKSPPIFYDDCNHPLARKKKEITSKKCDISNNFCPYKEIN